VDHQTRGPAVLSDITSVDVSPSPAAADQYRHYISWCVSITSCRW